MNNRMIQPQELDAKTVAMMRDRFERLEDVRVYRTRAERLKKEGKFMEALQIEKQLDAMFDKSVVKYFQDAESQVEELTLATMELPEADRETVNSLLVTFHMAVDILDSCFLDINDTLHKTNKALSYETVQDLQEMAQLCREQLRLYSIEGDYTKYADWGDITDNMYEMMQKKAKSIIRKTDAKRKKG